MLNLSRKRQLENTKSRNTLSVCAIIIHCINISVNFYQTGQIPAVSRLGLNRDLLLSCHFQSVSDSLQPLVTVDSEEWSLLLVSLLATARPAHGAEISVTTPPKRSHCCLKSKDSHRPRKISRAWLVLPSGTDPVEVRVVLRDLLLLGKGQRSTDLCCQAIPHHLHTEPLRNWILVLVLT